MRAIVSVTRDWAIGHEGGLLVRNPRDMRFFREMTSGGTVLMGRTTFEGLPHGALPKRRNVVLSHDVDYAAAGIEVAHSLEEALDLVEGDDPDRVWLIGGAAVYAALIDCCHEAYVTRNDVTLPADAYFPDLAADPAWRLSKTLESGVTDEGIPYTMCVFENLALG